MTVTELTFPAFRAAVSNAGPDEATDVQLIFSLSNGTPDNITSYPSICHFPPTCPIPSIPAGTTVVVDASVGCGFPGVPVLATATALSDEIDPFTADNAAAATHPCP